MKVIIFTRPDGGVSIVYPALRARLCAAAVIAGVRHRFDPPVPFDNISQDSSIESFAPDWAETEEDFVARIQAKDVPPDATDVNVIDASTIPTDRTYRNAWIQTNGVITVDMTRVDKKE